MCSAAPGMKNLPSVAAAAATACFTSGGFRGLRFIQLLKTTGPPIPCHPSHRPSHGCGLQAGGMIRRIVRRMAGRVLKCAC